MFDVNFGADLTIMEEGAELLTRLKHVLAPQLEEEEEGESGVAAVAHGSGHHATPGPLPMFTSCCPAWVK